MNCDEALLQDILDNAILGTRLRALVQRRIDEHLAAEIGPLKAMASPRSVCVKANASEAEPQGGARRG